MGDSENSRRHQERDDSINHIFREGNQTADYLANLAINQAGFQEFKIFKELPIVGRCITNNDKAQILNIRIKTKDIRV